MSATDTTITVSDEPAFGRRQRRAQGIPEQTKQITAYIIDGTVTEVSRLGGSTVLHVDGEKVVYTPSQSPRIGEHVTLTVADRAATDETVWMPAPPQVA